MSDVVPVEQQQGGPLVDVSEFGPTQFFDDTEFLQMAKPGFLPRLQLCGSNTELAKEGKINVAHYALVQSSDSFKDLGKEVHIIPLAVRFCAIRSGESGMTTFYNPESPEFRQIIADSEDSDSGCFYGPQFLVYVPAVKELATFLFGSKTARPEARNLKPLIGHAATMRARLIKGQRFSWHVPQVLQCLIQLERPDISGYSEQIKKFKNPGESSIEFNPEGTSDSGQPQTTESGRVM